MVDVDIDLLFFKFTLEKYHSQLFQLYSDGSMQKDIKLKTKNNNNTLRCTIVKYLTLTLFFTKGQIKKKNSFCLDHDFIFAEQ